MSSSHYTNYIRVVDDGDEYAKTAAEWQSSRMSAYKEKFKNMYTILWVSCLISFAFAITGSIFYGTNDGAYNLKYELYFPRNFYFSNEREWVVNFTNGINDIFGTCKSESKMSTQQASWGGNTYTVTTVPSYYAQWSPWVFTLLVLWITFAFSGLRCLFYNMEALWYPDGPCFWRWLEYAITSPQIIVVLAMGSGVRDIGTVAGLAGAQALLVLLGYLLEVQIEALYRTQYWRLLAAAQDENLLTLAHNRNSACNAPILTEERVATHSRELQNGSPPSLPARSRSSSVIQQQDGTTQTLASRANPVHVFHFSGTSQMLKFGSPSEAGYSESTSVRDFYRNDNLLTQRISDELKSNPDNRSLLIALLSTPVERTKFNQHMSTFLMNTNPCDLDFTNSIPLYYLRILLIHLFCWLCFIIIWGVIGMSFDASTRQFGCSNANTELPGAVGFLFVTQIICFGIYGLLAVWQFLTTYQYINGEMHRVSLDNLSTLEGIWRAYYNYRYHHATKNFLWFSRLYEVLNIVSKGCLAIALISLGGSQT